MLLSTVMCAPFMSFFTLLFLISISNRSLFRKYLHPIHGAWQHNFWITQLYSQHAIAQKEHRMAHASVFILAKPLIFYSRHSIAQKRGGLICTNHFNSIKSEIRDTWEHKKSPLKHEPYFFVRIWKFRDNFFLKIANGEANFRNIGISNPPKEIEDSSR